MKEKKTNSEGCSVIKKHYILAFFISLTISLGLIITSFFLPPTGEISPSVLQGVGELFAYPALAFAAKALEEGRTARFRRGNTTVEVGDLNNSHRHFHPDFDGGIEEEEDANQGTEDYQPHP